MSSGFRPIKTNDFRRFLIFKGLILERIKGNHEIWSKPGLNRPVIVQRKSKDLSPMVVKSNLNTLGISLKSLFDFINN